MLFCPEKKERENYRLREALFVRPALFLIHSSLHFSTNYNVINHYTDALPLKFTNEVCTLSIKITHKKNAPCNLINLKEL